MFIINGIFFVIIFYILFVVLKSNLDFFYAPLEFIIRALEGFKSGFKEKKK